MTTTNPAAAPPPRPRHQRYPRVTAIALVVLAVLSTAGLVGAAIRERGRIQCQADVNGVFSHALKERSAATQTAAQAEADALGAFLDPKGTTQTRVAALTAWRAKLDTLAQTQQANPLPDASTCR
jgi:hypothetical protein